MPVASIIKTSGLGDNNRSDKVEDDAMKMLGCTQ